MKSQKIHFKDSESLHSTSTALEVPTLVVLNWIHFMFEMNAWYYVSSCSLTTLKSLLFYFYFSIVNLSMSLTSYLGPKISMINRRIQFLCIIVNNIYKNILNFDKLFLHPTVSF